jgi:hypothetical protein
MKWLKKYEYFVGVEDKVFSTPIKKEPMSALLEPEKKKIRP